MEQPLMSPRCVVFLDFDGTVVTRATPYLWADGHCIEALNRITDATGAAIVVSSSHRSSIEGARVLLGGWGATGQVIDLTAHCSGGRAAEIQGWLAEHPVQQFVILDDAALDDDPPLSHVRIDPRSGLTSANAERAIAILNARP
jgi:hypothetical protein